MSNVLFDGINEIPDDIVIEKMNYFIKEAEVGMELSKTDEKESLMLAKRLRKELEQEYKNNDLKRISEQYKEHRLFSAFYKPAIEDTCNKITGQLSQKNYHSFLDDVEFYMNHYLSQVEVR